MALGLASGVRAIVKTRLGNLAKIEEGGFTIASSNTACRRAGIPSITIELSGQSAVVPDSVEEGRAALRNLLKHVGVLPGKPELPARSLILDPWRDLFVGKNRVNPSSLQRKARRAGIAAPQMRPYDRVRKGDLVCAVADPYAGKTVDEARAPMGGARHHIHHGGPCDRGDRLFPVSTARTVSRRASGPRRREERR